MTNRRTFIVSVPVYNLVINKENNSEIQVENVIFISRNKISFARRRLGFRERISEIDKYLLDNLGQKLFDTAETFAVMKLQRAPEDSLLKPMLRVRESIWILASSLFSPSTRGNTPFFGFPEHKAHLSHEYLVYDTQGTSSKYTWTVISPIFPFTLDNQWKQIMKHHFFPSILRIINKNITVNSKWYYSVRKSVILAGKSILSSDLPQAFMYDMIALETLLTYQGDKFPDAIIERLNAFFSWYFQRHSGQWEKTIKRLYKLRCKMVHDGETGEIKTEDLISADTLLYNVLINIGIAIKAIKNKKDLIHLAEIIKARKVLGINKRLPFRARFQTPRLSDQKLQQIKEKMLWPK